MTSLPILAPTYTREYRISAKTALETALSSVPAYQTWRRHDRPSADIFARYQAMPVLTKVDLREHQPAEFVPQGRDLAAALARGEVELVKTSGSTSDAVTNVWCQEWWDASEACSWKLHTATESARLGAHREAILASPRCVGFASDVGYLSMEQRTLWNYLFLSEKADPAEWSATFCDRMIEELGRFEPVVFEANPSFLSVLCRHAIKHHRAVYQPAVVTLTYENPSLIHLRHIRSVFSCPVISSYGATESGYVFMQCEAGRLHQNVEHCHVDFQPLDPRHGRPAVGRILVTTFHNPWRVLVRFDMGDLVRLAAEPCPCGRHQGLTLDAIEGRFANATLSLAGRLVTQRQADAAIAEVDGIDQYELVQTAADTVSLRTVSDTRNPAAIAPELRASLQRCYGASVKIILGHAQSLSPVLGVKYRLTRADFDIDIDRFLAESP
jgi:phenylacetate-coenzyme A ligase PaaK-like adenylate-forming protein